MITNPFEIIHNRLLNIEVLLLDIKHGSNEGTEPQKANLTKREAANELSCSIPMIDKLVQSGRLEKIKIGAKVLIPRTSIEKILSNKKC